MSEATILQALGPVDDWLISADEIERVTSGLCEHLIEVRACRSCSTDRMFVRQVELLADRLGLSSEQAAELARQYAAERRGEPS